MRALVRRNSDEDLRREVRGLSRLTPQGAVRLFLRALRAGAFAEAEGVRGYAFDMMEGSGGFADRTGWHEAWSAMADAAPGLYRRDRLEAGSIYDPLRQNPGDEDLRDLERRARAGDAHAARLLQRELARRGLPQSDASRVALSQPELYLLCALRFWTGSAWATTGGPPHACLQRSVRSVARRQGITTGQLNVATRLLLAKGLIINGGQRAGAWIKLTEAGVAASEACQGLELPPWDWRLTFPLLRFDVRDWGQVEAAAVALAQQAATETPPSTVGGSPMSGTLGRIQELSRAWERTLPQILFPSVYGLRRVPSSHGPEGSPDRVRFHFLYDLWQGIPVERAQELFQRRMGGEDVESYATNPLDDDRRGLEREFEATGDPATGARLAVAMLRAGTTSQNVVRWFTRWERRAPVARAGVLLAVDNQLIGTPAYLGYAYFWNHDYRHALRDAPPAKRKRVHARLIAAGLPLDGVSPRHAAIIEGRPRRSRGVSTPEQVARAVLFWIRTHYGPDNATVRGREEMRGHMDEPRAPLYLVSEGGFNRVLDGFEEPLYGQFTQFLTGLGWGWDNDNGVYFPLYPLRNDAGARL